jgi:predicted DNA-binding protein YlxM (UPF0122 family)
MYMQYETDGYSQYQTYLYKRALYGLDALSQQELATMCSKKKQRVSNVYVKGQKIINLYKQKLSIAYSNMVFKKFFPDSPLTNYFLSNQETDINYVNTLTFKDLNISKEDIITVFIEEGVLPKNFHSITVDPNFLPKLRNSGS